MFQQQKENRLQHFDLQAIKGLLLYSKREDIVQNLIKRHET